MKLKPFLLAVNLFTLVGAVSARADITLNYNFTSAATVPDGFGQLSDVKTLGGLSGMTEINNVVTRLNLSTSNVNDPMFLGDLYSSLTLGTSSEAQRIAVLLNRPGRDNTSAFGSGLSSLDVTLDDSTAGTHVWSTTSSTGTYSSDGRLGVNPNAAGVAFASGSNSLTVLDGVTLASNRVSLLVADFSQGGTATLAGWGVSVTGTAATSGTFTPGANASISDSGPSPTTVGAILNTTGASGGSLMIDLAGTMTFSNGVTGSAGLNKAGAGTLVLEGVSNFNGATTVTAGKLTITGAIATSSVLVSSGGTLAGESSDGGLTNGKVSAITLSGGSGTGGILAPGNGTAGDLGALYGTSLTWNGATESTFSQMLFDLGSSNASDKLELSGAMTKGTGSIFEWDFGNTGVLNSTYTLVTALGGFGIGATLFDPGDFTPKNLASGVTGSFSISGNNLQFTTVPEPTSAVVGLLIGAGLLRRRRVV